MNKKIKNRIVFYTMLLVLFVIVNIVVSFAYLRGRANNNESVSTIAIEGVGEINVTYSSNTPNIVVEDILPGYETVKKFSVTSNISSGGTLYKRGIWYQIRLVVDTNEFFSGSLVYSLSLDDNSSTNGITALSVDKIAIPNGVNQDGILVGTGYFSSDNVSHIYNLKLNYVNMEEVDQSNDYQKKFAAHVVIDNPDYLNLTFNLDGGSFENLKLNSNSTMKAAVNSTINLPIPNKEGYIFTGWEIISGNGTINRNELYINDTNITVKANYREQSFADDSWEEIATAIRNGNTDGYKLGDTREIAIDGYTNGEADSNGLYTLRIVNKSMPSECNNLTFSETACGFVIEFVDIIEQRAMNTSNTGVGGWPVTIPRTILNDSIYSKLPPDLKEIILDTRVISGRVGCDSSNFTTTDKLYMYTSLELFGTQYRDSLSETRKLDYYKEQGTLTSNCGAAVKKLNGDISAYWQRTACVNTSNSCAYYTYVTTAGCPSHAQAANSYGIAPVFRIG